jgi:cytochrome c5
VPNHSRLAAAVLVALALGHTSLAAQGLPEGAGAAIAKARCSTCHDTDLIAVQRLTLSGWTREVDKMIRWGARPTEAERTILLAFLAESFGPSHAAPQAADRTATGVPRACLACHGSELIEAQRLTRAGWSREVAKMVRWGAVLSQADQELLSTSLSVKYGPTSKTTR